MNSSIRSAGQLIDIAIRAAQARSGTDLRLTDFVNEEIAPKADLSLRQITRMRDYDGFPEDQAMKKLIQALPELTFLKPVDLFGRILLPWQNIEADQSRLPKPSSYTIFSGWKPPVGITNPDVAKSIARNINDGDRYTFVYPHSSTYPKGEKRAKSQVEQWMNNLKGKVTSSWHHIISEENDGTALPSDVLEDVANFQRKVDQALGCVFASAKTDLWFLLPAPYCVYYNLGLKNKDSSFRHGAFLTEGLLMDEDEVFADKVKGQGSVTSQGWLLTTSEQYTLVEASLTKGGVENWDQYVKDLLP